MILMHLCSLVLKSRTMAWRKKHYHGGLGVYLLQPCRELSPEAQPWEWAWDKALGRGRVGCVLSELKSAHPFWRALALGCTLVARVYRFQNVAEEKDAALWFSKGFDILRSDPWPHILSHWMMWLYGNLEFPASVRNLVQSSHFTGEELRSGKFQEWLHCCSGGGEKEDWL